MSLSNQYKYKRVLVLKPSSALSGSLFFPFFRTNLGSVFRVNSRESKEWEEVFNNERKEVASTGLSRLAVIIQT